MNLESDQARATQKYRGQSEKFEENETVCPECGGLKAWDEGFCPDCLASMKDLDEQGNKEKMP